MKTATALENFAECGSELKNETREFAEKGREFLNTAATELRRTGRRARLVAADAIEEGRAEIKENPFTAVSLAVVSGLVFGFFSGILVARRYNK